jgi:hypothetical protein
LPLPKSVAFQNLPFEGNLVTSISLYSISVSSSLSLFLTTFKTNSNLVISSQEYASNIYTFFQKSKVSYLENALYKKVSSQDLNCFNL